MQLSEKLIFKNPPQRHKKFITFSNAGSVLDIKIFMLIFRIDATCIFILFNGTDITEIKLKLYHVKYF